MHVLLLFSLLFAKPRPDTINNWQIYQNKKQLAAYTVVNAETPLVIKKTQIKPSDILTVDYSRDTPCSECATSLSIRDHKDLQVKLIRSKGTFTPFKFVLYDLVRLNKGTYYFYRSEAGGRDPDEHLLFKLIIK